MSIPATGAGKRWVPAPTDAKRSITLSQLLAHTAAAAGSASCDAWVGHPAINPAKGRGHAPDPSALRGRPDLFALLQQRVLRDGPAADEAAEAAQADAWVGNRLIQPNKGKRATEQPEADHLHAATWAGGVPADGCWCDLPPVGKRPLAPPSAAGRWVTAAQCVRVEEALPPGTVVGRGRPQGRGLVADPFRSADNPHRVDVFSLLTFQQLSPGEADRCGRTWDDAAHPARKAAVPGAAAAAGSARSMLASQPARETRCVPFGGIAQERGRTVDTIVASRAQACGGGRGGGASSSRAPPATVGAGRTGPGARGSKQGSGAGGGTP
ncbi:hypothetical protein HT031_002892 [Scenedesmus sp. PABB004]|nr:hypothetical protein HT031_002892 [Scenedesmus sp. PABB004]